ncbi:ferredoxin [Nocardioides sp. NPDC101246]|uniref:ferredoxin n=1 Tax=Nocardioides sp. NPDC101246 TaxID=3364336 RepID=UPI003807DCB9
MSAIEADKTVCEGIGMCETQADTYFQIGDDGLVEVLVDEVPDPDRGYVKAAVDSCPVSALRLLG